MILTLILIFVIVVIAIGATIFIVRKRTQEDCENLNVSSLKQQIAQSEKEIALDQNILANIKRDVALINSFPTEAATSINSIVKNDE